MLDPADLKPLTPKQAAFVAEYLVDLNGKAAAARAGYAPKNSDVTAAKLLKMPHIIAAIDAAKLARSKRTQIDADWLLKTLADEAQADIADLYDENGDLLPVKEWPLIWRQGLVQGIEVESIEVEGVTVGKVKKIKLDSRIRRKELIGKHIKVNAFAETVNHTGLDALADRLERAFKRLDE